MGEQVIEEEQENSYTDDSYDANDPKEVNRARKKAAREKMQHDEVIRGIMSIREGRKWIYHILEFSSMFGNPIGSDVYATHVNIGMANIGKMIWAEVEDAAPEFCATMLKEAKKNAREQEI